MQILASDFRKAMCSLFPSTQNGVYIQDEKHKLCKAESRESTAEGASSQDLGVKKTKQKMTKTNVLINGTTVPVTEVKSCRR